MTENRRLPVSALVGDTADAARHIVPTARDQVLVVKLQDGGLISYLRSDGTILHTLNTTIGFERKLRQLGIDVAVSPGKTD